MSRKESRDCALIARAWLANCSASLSSNCCKAARPLPTNAATARGLIASALSKAVIASPRLYFSSSRSPARHSACQRFASAFSGVVQDFIQNELELVAKIVPAGVDRAGSCNEQKRVGIGDGLLRLIAGRVRCERTSGSPGRPPSRSPRSSRTLARTQRARNSSSCLESAASADLSARRAGRRRTTTRHVGPRVRVRPAVLRARRRSPPALLRVRPRPRGCGSGRLRPVRRSSVPWRALRRAFGLRRGSRAASVRARLRDRRPLRTLDSCKRTNRRNTTGHSR